MRNIIRIIGIVLAYLVAWPLTMMAVLASISAILIVIAELFDIDPEWVLGFVAIALAIWCLAGRNKPP
jgi:hypothetical protein